MLFQLMPHSMLVETLYTIVSTFKLMSADCLGLASHLHMACAFYCVLALEVSQCDKSVLGFHTAILI